MGYVNGTTVLVNSMTAFLEEAFASHNKKVQKGSPNEKRPSAASEPGNYGTLLLGFQIPELWAVAVCCLPRVGQCKTTAQRQWSVP